MHKSSNGVRKPSAVIVEDVYAAVLLAGCGEAAIRGQVYAEAEGAFCLVFANLGGVGFGKGEDVDFAVNAG